jgi:TP901 family phage tail tape measure protein
MFENYKIAIKIAVTDEATRAISLLTRHLLQSEEAAGKLQSRLATIKGFFIGGTALMGTGAALAAPLLYAVDKAAELQKQLIGVQIATRGTAQQMDQMRGVIEKVAGVTVFSNIDVAKMAKTIATGTGLGASQVQSLLPAYAKFADVQLLMKGTPYGSSIPEAIRLAHTAQHYDAGSLTTYLDLLTKASFIVPGGLSEVGHALKYSQGMGKTALGIDDQNMVLLTAFLNRLGLAGSRGGTNAIAAMTRSIPGIFGSGLLTGKSNQALAAMGMIDSKGHSLAFQNGKFDMFSWLGLMGDYVQREFASHPEAIARQDILKNFQHAFGVQGSRVASLMSSPEAIKQFRQIGNTFSQYGGVEGMQKKFADESVAQQWMNAKTNFMSAMVEIGMTLLPTATTALQKLNGYLKTFIEWLTKNPDKVKQYATNIGLLAIALTGLGIVSVVTSGITGLVTALGLLGPAIAGATAAATAANLATVASRTGKLGVLGLTAYTAYEATDLIANKWLGADSKLGSLFAPSYENRPNLRKNGYQIQVHVHNKIDKHGLATMVTDEQAKAFSGPETSAAAFDTRMHLAPPGAALAY